jgi:putative endonuclease
MVRHIDFGRAGEELAVTWLQAKGYEVLERNWRHGRHEVDIIAIRDGVYHFIEVKCSRTSAYGYPEERVNKIKLKNMMRGAATWLCRIPGKKQVQYNVLAITISNGGTPEYAFFEDVSL